LISYKTKELLDKITELEKVIEEKEAKNLELK